MEQEYESEDVADKQYTNQRAAPELVLADAPKGPRFGGKGLQSNTTYQMSEEEETDTGQAESETRTGVHNGTLEFVLTLSFAAQSGRDGCVSLPFLS